MADPPPYGILPGDVRAVNRGAGVSDDQVAALIVDTAGEVDTHWAVKGVSTPVTGNDTVVGMIRAAIKQGVAGAMEGAPVMSSPYNSATLINVYRAEYKRMLDWIDALTPVQIYALGIGVLTTDPTPLPAAVGLGLGTVPNYRVRGSGPSWHDVPPVQQANGRGWGEGWWP